MLTSITLKSIKPTNFCLRSFTSNPSSCPCPSSLLEEDIKILTGGTMGAIAGIGAVTFFPLSKKINNSNDTKTIELVDKISLPIAWFSTVVSTTILGALCPAPFIQFCKTACYRSTLLVFVGAPIWIIGRHVYLEFISPPQS